MQAIESELHARAPLGFGGRFYGVYPATVVRIDDPDNQGRVQVRLPWSVEGGDDEYLAWARLATLMAGDKNQGSWFVPDRKTEVLVIFEGGDPRRPYVIGALWNGAHAPPETMDADQKNPIKKIRSRNGIEITLDDTDGTEKLTLKTPGENTVTLENGPAKIELTDGNGNRVTLESSGVTVSSAGMITLQASGVVDVQASSVNVTAGMATFSGAVQAQSFISPSIVGSTYTPGAGNIW